MAEPRLDQICNTENEMAFYLLLNDWSYVMSDPENDHWQGKPAWKHDRIFGYHHLLKAFNTQKGWDNEPF